MIFDDEGAVLAGTLPDASRPSPSAELVRAFAEVCEMNGRRSDGSLIGVRDSMARYIASRMDGEGER